MAAVLVDRGQLVDLGEGEPEAPQVLDDSDAPQRLLPKSRQLPGLRPNV